MPRLAWCLAMFWCLSSALVVTTFAEFILALEVKQLKLIITVFMLIPLSWTTWLKVQRFRFWWIYGDVRCCVRNCPQDSNLRPVVFHMLGVKKLACEYHINAVVNSHGQRRPVQKMISQLKEIPEKPQEFEETAESRLPEIDRPITEDI